MKNLSAKKTWLIALFIFGFFLIIYWRTCCRTIFWWDSAEFVAAVATLGIPHPPSFPLYILIGKVFSFLPFTSLAFKLNLLSGILSALSLGIFFFLFLKFTRIFNSSSGEHVKLLLFSSFLSVLVTGLNYAFWIQGVRAEVYSLNGLIFVLLFHCGMNFLSETQNEVSEKVRELGRARCPTYEKSKTYIHVGVRQRRTSPAKRVFQRPQNRLKESEYSHKDLGWIFLFFFIFGLGMGNHNVTLISTLPAFIFMFLSYNFHNILRPKVLIFSLIFLLLGCSVYLYLPLRAINSPTLNWGNPLNLKGVLTSALALKSFKQIGFALNYTLWQRAKDAWMMIYSQFTLFPFLLSLLGLFILFRRNLKLSIFFLLLIMGNSSTIIVLPSEFISTSSDFQGYILPTIFSLGLLLGFGVFHILMRMSEWVSGKAFSLTFRKSLVFVFSVFFFSISLLPFLTYYHLTDLSENDLAYRYGKEVLSGAKKGAVLILDNPNLYFILSALRYGEGYRKDVAVLDRGLLQAEWNCYQERRNYPEVFSEVRSKLKGEDLILSLISEGLNRNIPLYMEYTPRDTDFVDFLLPSGHLFKMEKRIITFLPEKILSEQGEFEKEYFAQKDEKSFQNDLDAQRMFVFVTYHWGLYYEGKGLIEEALRNFYLARELDPFNLELRQRIEKLKYKVQLAKS